jgi:hypothetical protein
MCGDKLFEYLIGIRNWIRFIIPIVYDRNILGHINSQDLFRVHRLLFLPYSSSVPGTPLRLALSKTAS